jgi:RimJ/RimL family protein N-acetyltransferase
MEITENLEIVSFTPKTLMFLWEQMRRFPQLFDDRFKDRYDLFTARMMAPTTIVASYKDGPDKPASGILYFTELLPRGSAVFHLFFWDKTVRGREQAILDFWKWGFTTFDLHKIIIMLPQFVKYLRRLLWSHGVIMEGKLREDFLHNGKWYDVYVFGVLREEVDKLNLTEENSVEEQPQELSQEEEGE